MRSRQKVKRHKQQRRAYSKPPGAFFLFFWLFVWDVLYYVRRYAVQDGAYEIKKIPP